MVLDGERQIFGHSRWLFSLQVLRLELVQVLGVSKSWLDFRLEFLFHAGEVLHFWGQVGLHHTLEMVLLDCWLSIRLICHQFGHIIFSL